MLIGLNCRKQFKKGKLTEKGAFFGTIVVYEIKGLVKIERFFKEEDKNITHDKVHNMLRYLFWEFEYEEGMVLTARQISYILGVDHTTVDNILARCKQRMRDLGHLDYYY